MSIGTERVRLDFNVNANENVQKIKQQIADFIDFCEDMKSCEPRLMSLAQTAAEQAAMWAVKAVTTPPLSTVKSPE